MNLTTVDWIIVISFLMFLAVASLFARKYSGSVVNFLAAGRCAGRYLIAVAGGMAGWGAISAVAAFEMYYKAGFSIQWWFFLMMVANLLASISGWMVYRFRQTRSLTVPQFLEQRYSRNLRVFAGVLCWFSGVMNFGLFPAVGARFFIHFCGLPSTFNIVGINFSTYAAIMIFLLGFALYILFIGGQISVIITDFIQGLFCNIIFVILMIFLFSVFSWSQITESLNTAERGQSMINPFDASKTSDFNLWFYIIGFFSLFYSWIVGAYSQGYEVSAINPHEARMGKILNNWRSIAQQLIIILLPICAFTLLHHPDFSASAHRAYNIINLIVGRNQVETNALQVQMTVPVAMSVFLGKGLMGAMCAVMLAAFIGNHDTYLHSWGSIFIQDVILPLRKKPLAPEEHIRYLRWSIFGVAVLIFVFSLFYRQNEYILMFMMFTATIYIAGAGVVMIGGLYWKKGTAAAAWTSLILGVGFAFGGQIIRRIWPEFPINSQWVFAIAMISCSVTYVVVSLFGNKEFDMDKLLHRGEYAISDDAVTKDQSPVRGWRVLFHMGKEFTLRDKIVYLSSIGWTLLLCLTFLIGTLCNMIFDISNKVWTKFWWIYVIVMFILSVITTIWFIVGGMRDYFKMFSLLKIRKYDETDDGRTVEHLAEANVGDKNRNAISE